MDNDNTNIGTAAFDYILPKKLEGTEDGKKIPALLRSHLKPVKPGNEYLIPCFPSSKPILDALIRARRTDRLIRGFEDGEKLLYAEGNGIENIDNKTGINRRERISRLIVVANDGSDRFYRQTKRLAEKNRPRVMAILLDITSFELGETIFGPGKRALFLLISHKDSVTGLLTSLINDSKKSLKGERVPFR